jgi:hypothetical protein
MAWVNIGAYYIAYRASKPQQRRDIVGEVQRVQLERDLPHPMT